jgi:hypothetical protein
LPSRHRQSRDFPAAPPRRASFRGRRERGGELVCARGGLDGLKGLSKKQI